jgi:GNAT superfamily N-acetyltransferase
MGLTAPQPLAPDHDLDAFNSGVAELDIWLKKRARLNEATGASRTFVLCKGKKVVGYYCLATASIFRAEATGNVRRNMPDPIPAVLIGRLAVDKASQGKGYGVGLLQDAVLRIAQASQTIGIRAILVHAKSNNVRAFYERFGFRSSPIEPMTMMLTIEEVLRHETH